MRAVSAVLLLILLAACTPAPIAIDGGDLHLNATDRIGDFRLSFPNGANTAWQASANVPWLNVDPASGTGDAQITVTVDAGHPDIQQPGTYAATITVATANDEETLAVTYVVPAVGEGEGEGELPGEFSEAGPVSTAYFPLDIGNAWTFRTIDAASPLFPNVGFSLTVRDRFSIGEFDVAELTLTVDAFAWAPFDIAAATLPIDIPLYLVFADDEHVITADRASIDALPQTAGFARLAALLRTPESILHGLESDAFARFEEDVRAELTRIELQLGPAQLGPELDAYARADDYAERLAALASAFAAEFHDYAATDDPAANELAQLMAALALTASDLQALAASFDEIAATTLQQLIALGPSVEAYIRTEESVGESVALLRFLAAELTAFESTDDTTANLASALAALVAAVADVVETLDEGEFTADDEAIDAFNTAVLSFILSDPGVASFDGSVLAFIDALIAFIESYETTANGVAELADIYLDALVAVRNGVAEIVADPFRAESIAGFAELADHLAAFLAAYSSAHTENVLSEYLGLAFMTVDQGLDALLAFRPAVEELDLAARDFFQAFLGSPFLEGSVLPYARTFDDAAAFFTAYNETNGDVLAESLAIVTSGAADITESLEQYRAASGEAEFVVERGALSSFLPVEVYGGYTLTIDELFTGEDLPDVEATLVTVQDENAPARQIPTAIFARGVGPVLLGGALTLERAVIGGVEIVARPTWP